ncbi:Aste57867_15312 [Aphanomyces stellatus]|uniref:Aste57867_15312 protein n=1 Tax=Aphanomyces stellatus TaxID=120398 RepID=A0A485L5R2_9STRA|nr:hypothetical protein As57867_015256 [Aphanomyces stellatus]VFT92121.1 Aste57867_15312 [Aphanomyces stellatus]
MTTPSFPPPSASLKMLCLPPPSSIHMHTILLDSDDSDDSSCTPRIVPLPPLSPPPPPPPSIARCCVALVGSAAFAALAAPLVLLSSFLFHVSCRTLPHHVSVLLFLWRCKARVLTFLGQLPSPSSLSANISYGTLYFGLWNLVDVVCAAGPVALAAVGCSLAVHVMTVPLVASTLVFEAATALAALGTALFAAVAATRHIILPVAVAFARPPSSSSAQAATMLPQTPCTPRDGDGFFTTTPYRLDAKMALGDRLSGSWLAAAIDRAVLRFQTWCDAAPLLPVHHHHSPTFLFSSDEGDDSSPMPASSSDEDVDTPRSSIVSSSSTTSTTTTPDRHACAALIQRNFQRRIGHPTTRRSRQPARRPSPSAPDAALLHVPLRQLAPLATLQRQQVSRRPGSQSSSDEEDFQVLCDTILKRRPAATPAPVAGPARAMLPRALAIAVPSAESYDALSPRAAAATKPPRSPLSPGHHRPVSRGLVDASPPPCFTAFAPKVIAPNSSFHLVVGCHTANADDVAELRDLAGASARPVARTLTVDPAWLPHGTRVTISIQVPPGFQVLSPSLHETLTWRAHVDAIAFHIFAEGSLAPHMPHTVVVKVVADQFVGVLHCRVVVGPRGVSKLLQCQDEWYEMQPVSDALEVLAPGFDEIAYHDLHLQKWIGQGHFGDAYLADYRGHQVVVKTLRTTDIAALQHEAAVQSMFGHHPCVVPFVGACTDAAAPLAVVTEYMPLGSLSSLVSSPAAASHYPAAIRTAMLRDAANGLAHLHDSAFLHRDVAARNCLVDAHQHVKVGDFGLARRGYVVESHAPVVGPLKWMAPETLQPPYVFSQASDVFGFGVTMWEVYQGTTPYADVDPMQVAVRVCEGDRLPLHGSHIQIPNAQIDLMGRCFDPNPEKRPSMVEIYNHLKPQ